MKLLGLEGLTMPAKVSAIAMAAAFALGSTGANAHFVSVDGEVEVDSPGYVKTSAGKAVGSTSGCVVTGDRTSDNQINACEGIEDAAEEVKTEAPKAEEPQQVAKVETITIDGVGLFGHDSDQLTAEGLARMNDLMAEMADFKGILGIEVGGHTDSSGSDEYNQALSERRAATVQGMLSAQYADVPIQAVGYGESQPVADNGTPAGMAQNRRVEVKVDASRMTFE